ncbi:MAG TPA: primosomal protein N' [Syntrophomonas sp.]|nr:primosomal protein N' [Syntrophomonas sp.]
MQAVSVIINLHTQQLNNRFLYLVPEELQAEALFGKRVLVDFRGRKTEAFVVDQEDNSLAAEFKPLIRVLDQEAVFDQELYDLAEWMAAYYAASLAQILSMMIPRLLHQQKLRRVISLVSQAEYEQSHTVKNDSGKALMELLWNQGEASVNETLKIISKEQLEELIENGLVYLTGVYGATRTSKSDMVYILDDEQYTSQIDAIRKKAPRQAEALDLLVSHPQMSCHEFDMMVSRSAGNALRQKNLIRTIRRQPVIQTPAFELNSEQKHALQAIRDGLAAAKHREFLLFGITGSGKTEVYIEACQQAIQQGKRVIVLVPEIALTRQLVDIFSHRIADMAVLHSAMSAGERYGEWKRIKRGEVQLVLGPRSAIFAPLPDLGLIIMDEEQENSYKQEETPRYHARDIARQRARITKAVLLLGTATPALETYYRTTAGDAQLLTLSKRTGAAAIPMIVIEDMKKTFKSGYPGMLSRYLQERLEHVLHRGEQSILFINRRGHSPMTICRECGNIASCPNCAVAMTYHHDIRQNVCHYCNVQRPQHSVCPTCGSQHLQMMGTGTQKVEEEIRQLYPTARIARLDLDSSRAKGAQKAILADMKAGRIDILIGTQMVAKGFDFPRVSLVGVVDADSLLNLPDFRARERCFQLLVQVAGRAGRANIPGEVVIQTYNPQEPLFEKVVLQDYKRFYEDEIEIRHRLDYPPFTEILRIVVSSEEDASGQAYINILARQIEEMIDAKEDSIMILGPAPCPISKIKSRYRYQLMIKCNSVLLLGSIAAKINQITHPANLRVEMDINPVVTI